MRRPRVLVVNCYFPEVREPLRLTHEIPNALAPVLLAAELHPERCEIRLHNEVSDGFLELYAPDLLAWPDLVVFTGLTTTLDRMRQLTAYFRTLNPRVVIAAGGIAVRALPGWAAKFFDYACTGDVEEIRDVIAEALGPAYVADDPVPRYDLARWIGRVGYAESTRGCTFRCGFCSVTADGRRFRALGLDAFRRQIVTQGRRDLLVLTDNQFYGHDRAFFLERLALLRELRAAGYFRWWHAFVTDAFLWDDENLALAREAGCLSLFVGVETFDEAWLRRVNKTQNNRVTQADLARKCLDAGIVFQYGLVFDPTERTLAEMHRELTLICDNPELPAPNFIFMCIPFPGTPLLHDRLRRGLILPRTRLRDLEASTLSLRPLDPIPDVARFIATTKNLVGYRWRHLKRQARFAWRYRRSLGPAHHVMATATCLSVVAPWALSSPRTLLARKHPRTHVSTTDRLDCVYAPVRRVDARFASYFAPTPITDEAGAAHPDVADDLLATRYLARAAVD